MTVNLNANETVIKAGDSLHLANDQKIQGKLILTNQRLFFTLFGESIEKPLLEFLPAHIKELLFFNTMRIIPNGLNIVTKDGKEHKFTIKKRDEWGSMINKMY